MYKKYNVLMILLDAILSLVFVGGLFAISFLLGRNANINYAYGYIVFSMILISVSIFNIVYSSKIKRKIELLKAQEQLNLIEEKKKWVNENQDQVRDKILKLYKKCVIYLVINYLLILIGIIYSGFIFPTIIGQEQFAFLAGFAGVIVVWAWIIIFIVFVINFSFITSNKQTNYKNLDEFIKNILKEEQIDKKYHISLILFSVECGISENKNQLVFLVGDLLLKYLSLDELKSIIYHEIAHYKNEDTKYLIKLTKYKLFFERFASEGLEYLLCPLLFKVSDETLLLETLSTQYYENKADDFVLSKSLNKEYALANVKIFGLSLFNQRMRPSINYNVFKNGKWSIEDAEAYYQDIYKYYMKNIDFIDLASKKHLKERVSTHPNVKERREKFYQGELDISLKENHCFDEDITNEFNVLNKRIAKLKIKNDFCLKYDEYQKQIANYQKKNTNELLDLLSQAMSFEDDDNALLIAQKLYAENEDNVVVNFALGTIFCNNFSSECIPYFQKVIESKQSFYQVQALMLLGNYYMCIGDEEGRNNIRNIQTKIIDNAKDSALVYNLLEKDKLIEYHNQEVINEINSLMQKYSFVEEVRAGIKTYNDVNCVHFLLVISNKYKDTEQLMVVNKQIKAYLDSINEQSEVMLCYKRGLKTFKNLKDDKYLIYRKDTIEK